MLKYPNHILAVSKDAYMHGIQKLNTLSRDDQFLERIKASLVIMRREELEHDERYWQLLPYVVLWQRNPETGERTLFTYARAKKGDGESRLLGNVSIGVGGHMELVDLAHSSGVVDVGLTIARAITRELNEEVLFVTAKNECLTYSEMLVGNCTMAKYTALINDESNAVGRVHLGLVYMLEVPEGLTPTAREDGMEPLGMFLPKTIAALPSQKENWTKLLLDDMLLEEHVANG